MITYKSIIQYFKGITNSHQQIKSFTYGEISLFDEDKFTKYPALHLTPTSTEIADQTITYGFEVVIFDRYDGENNKMENEAISLSDSLLILQDLCKELSEGKYFVTEDTLINLQLPIQATPFIDTKPDICSGWSTSFSISTPNESTACNIPYYLTEIWNNKNVTLPEGTPSQYLWYSMMNLGALANFGSDELTSLYPFVDHYGISTPLTSVGRGITYDYTKNAIHINSVSQALPSYLTDSVTAISGGKSTFFIKIKDFSCMSNWGNSLMKFTNGTTEVELYLRSTDSKLVFQNITSTEVSLYPVAPLIINAGSPTNEEQLRRKEPLVIALTFDALGQYMECWYGADKPIKITTSGIDLHGFNYIIGSTGDFVYESDFYLSEFMYCRKLLPESEIEAVREWLNYR